MRINGSREFDVRPASHRRMASIPTAPGNTIGPKQADRRVQNGRFWCPECVIITCEKCFSADDVTYQRLPDHAVLYTCSRSHSGEGPHSWIKSVSEIATPDELAAEGITDELLGPLSPCVDPDEPFVEYGIVEYRLRQRYPDLFLAHVRDRGHVILGPKAYTMAPPSVAFISTP